MNLLNGHSINLLLVQYIKLRNALLKEQMYICAYCMRRIPVKDTNIDATSKIEHLQSRENNPELQLSYTNMVICCPGNLNNEAHCDKLKGDNSISFDSHSAQLQQSISYSSKDGTIKSDNEIWNNEMNEFLNLNHAWLKRNRKSALEGVIEALMSKGWNISSVKQKYQEWSNTEERKYHFEYCGIVVWYLSKKLKAIK
jgi:uncharacterized protein (TIGR02646 family)